ncbi:MAG: CDP-alcohol phosphatidyltransferase family protein, partial [Kiritimatiellae bacterium]|nr:CDP-alcohol phosphatidyltransferase family protein [Kiritimatiellia bacterium]
MPRDAALASAAKPDEPALVTALFARRLAQPIASAAVRCGVGADCVTVAGGLCWILSLALPPLVWVLPAKAGIAAWLAAAFLWCTGYILDVADGSVARMTGTSSRAGFFLDYVFHLYFKPAFLFSVGLGLTGAVSSGAFDAMPPAGARPAAIAALAAIAVLSIPANGASAMCAAERALCFCAAKGIVDVSHGVPDASAWLGAADVSAPAAVKRTSRARAVRIFVAEVASYYLQAPFFALLVLLDALAALLLSITWMPFTLAGFVLLSLALEARIGFRARRESRRMRHGGRRAYAAFLLWLGAVPPALAAAVALPAVFGAGCAWRFLPIALSPLFAVFGVDSETSAAAHVFCQDFAKGKFSDKAAWRERDAALAAATRPPSRMTAAAVAAAT